MYKYTTYLRLSLIFLLFFFPNAAKADGYLSFSVFSSKSGFPARVNSVFPDNRGYLWIGSNKGIFRYDGYECWNINSLLCNSYVPEQDIRELNGDSRGHVWAVTSDNVLVYSSDSGSLLTIDICALCTAPSDNGILIASETAIYEFDFITQSLRELVSFDGTPPFRISSICSCPDGRYLCASRWQGIRLYDRSFKTYTVPYSLGNDQIMTVLIDSHKRVWLSFYNKGIACFDIDGGQISSYDTHNSGLSNDIVLSLLEKEGKIWLATDGGGICILNPIDDNVQVLKNKVGDGNSIPYDSILSIKQDSFGNIWAIRIRGGLFAVREVPAITFQAAPPGGNGLSYNSVLSLLQDNSSPAVWIGTDGGGLNLFDPVNRLFRSFPSTYGKKIVDIAYYSDNELLVSAFSEGLFIFNISDGSISKMPVSGGSIDFQLLHSGNAVNLHREASGKMLLLARPVFRYDPKTSQIRRIEESRPLVSQPVSIDGNGEETYIYDWKHIYSVYYDTWTLESLWEFEDDTKILSVSKSLDGKFWMSTNNGVYSFDVSDRKPIKLETSLFSSSSLVAAGRDRVWIATENSIYQWNMETRRFSSLVSARDVFPNEFQSKASLVSPYGYVYMGGSDGLLVIDTSLPPVETPQPEMSLSDVFVDSERIPGVPTGGKVRIGCNANSVDVTVHAEGDDFFAGRLFSFRLNGKESISQYSSKFTLRNLHPGKYSLDVSYETSQESQPIWTHVLSIVVLAPWYRSLAFFIILGAILLICLFYFVRRKIKAADDKTKRQISQLKQKSENEQMLLKLQYLVQLNIQEKNLDINRICRDLGVSHSALFTIIKTNTGGSIKDYIDGIRIDRAMELVKSSDLSFTEIADKTGFSSSRYFSTFFKRKTGMTPTEYRNQNQNIIDRLKD